MRKFLKILLKGILGIFLTVILLILIIFFVPIKINTKSDVLVEKDDFESYIYNDMEYTYATGGNLFGSLRDAGFKENIPPNFKKFAYQCNKEKYYLEYVFNGNVKRVYSKRINHIIDYIFPLEYLLIGDSYLVCIDKYWITTYPQILYSNNSIELPELKSENIEKMIKYIGVPDYDYYAENSNDFVEYLKADKDLYIVQKEEIFDRYFIDAIVKELNETGNIDKFINKETKENAKAIDEMQKKVDKHNEENFASVSVRVYYKIYFKDQDFPFRLILY